MGLRATALGLTASLLLAAGPASAADEAEVRSLRAELATLKLRLAAAEARLAQLETAPAQAAAASAPVSPAVIAVVPAPVISVSPPAAALATVAPAPAEGSAVYDRKAWRQVRAGTAQGEVLRLLGEPTRRLAMAGRTVWYYRYPDAGPGSVFFTEAGTVSSLQSP